MANIFLSHSSTDKDTFVNILAEELKQRLDSHNLLYYDRPIENCDNPMDIVLEKLNETDLFVVFLSHNSLESPFVKQEIDKAINLHKRGTISKIQPFLIDATLNPNTDNRIPDYIKNEKITYVNNPQKATSLIEKCCLTL